MRKKAMVALELVGAVAVATGLQAAPLPGFKLTVETEHFSFFTRDNTKVDARKSERFLGQIEQLLGHRLEGRAEYYRYGSPEELAAGTGTYAAGVTKAGDREIHSTLDFHAHEIVHLVAAQMGNPGTFFQEGLAVALGNDGRWNGKSVGPLAKPWARAHPVSRLAAGFDGMDPEQAYPVAGSFVASLIKSHGIAKMAAFFAACTGNNTAEAFAATFGMSLDEAGAAWAASL